MNGDIFRNQHLTMTIHAIGNNFGEHSEQTAAEIDNNELSGFCQIDKDF